MQSHCDAHSFAVENLVDDNHITEGEDEVDVMDKG